MNDSRISRRQCLGGLLSVSVPAALRSEPAGETVQLSNQALDFRITSRNGRILSRQLVNKLADEAVDLPVDDFELEFGAGVVAPSSSFSASVVRKTAEEIELLYRRAAGPLAGLEVRVEYRLPVQKAYLRKQMAVREVSGPGRRLMRADLENWRGVKRLWQSGGQVLRYPYGSHPIYCDTLWAGVEFVAAFNEYGDGGFVLRSRPGGKPLDADWYALNSTVAGCSEPGGAREAFLSYIDNVRLAPPRLVACYNTWWTYYAKQINADDLRALAGQLKKSLFDKHGVFFDIFTTDEGWADRHTIWGIDREKLPRGFADLRAIVESAGGRLGLWISPSAVYPNSTDPEWAKSNGYVVSEFDYTPPSRHPGLSLADPKYRMQAIERLQQLIRENNLRQVKYDGFIAREAQGHQDLLPGDDSVEPLAHYSLDLMAASRKANPDLVAEPTYLNSYSNYISPWIIKYADSVWGNSGGDCPHSIGVPAPDYRETHTTSREYFIFSSFKEVWLPQNALQYFDIVHADEDAGFPNHAAMAFGRGRFFVPTYVNPKFMSDDDWRVYAGLLRWARQNKDILRHTHVLPSRVEVGEPYVYAHWLGMRGVLAVRNPSNDTVSFDLDLRRARAPRGLSDAVCYSQYPCRKGFASGVSQSSTLPLVLAPWELLFLDIVPRAELSEPVAIGARWYRGPGGAMSIAAEPGIDSVRVLKPNVGEEAIRVAPRAPANVTGVLDSYAVRRLPPTDTIGFETACTVTIPAGASGKVLLLLQFPGREHRSNRCQAVVNGVAAALGTSSSEHRTGEYPRGVGHWREVAPYLTQWTWHICDVGPGTFDVKFTGDAAHPDCRIGLWAWMEQDVTPFAKTVSIDCPEPAMPPYRAHLARHALCLRRPIP